MAHRILRTVGVMLCTSLGNPVSLGLNLSHMGVSENRGYLNFGVLIMRILLFRVL